MEASTRVKKKSRLHKSEATTATAIATVTVGGDEHTKEETAVLPPEKKSVLVADNPLVKYKSVFDNGLCLNKKGERGLWLLPHAFQEAGFTSQKGEIGVVIGLKHGLMYRTSGRCIWGFSQSECVADEVCEKCVTELQEKNEILASKTPEDRIFVEALEEHICMHSLTYNDCPHSKLVDAKYAKKIPPDAITWSTEPTGKDEALWKKHMKTLRKFLCNSITAMGAYESEDEECFHKMDDRVTTFLAHQETDWYTDDSIDGSFEDECYNENHYTMTKKFWLISGGCPTRT